MKKRILLFAVSLIFVLGFTACGKAKQSAEELIQQENEIIAEHQDLWDLAFNAVDKDTVGSQTGDYADFLNGSGKYKGSAEQREFQDPE